jgi:tRNA (guanine37-N1)-methyltransferase
VRIAVGTLFPELFDPFLRCGVVGRAVSSGLVEIEIHDIRDHAVDARGSVDDYQFGGGAGMVMRPEPLFGTLRSVQWREGAKVLMMSPHGRRLDHDLVRELAGCEGLVVFCGRYGGVDERFVETAVDDEVSVGDFVTSGGELPAMVLIEAVLRWIPGVLGRIESAMSDSFATGLVDYPRYTRPADFEGMKVPEELVSGNHAQVENWRFQQALERTRARRPELLESRSLGEMRAAFVEAMRLAARAKGEEDGPASEDC